MAYQTVLQTPETPIREVWRWTTDLQRSYNGTEDLTPLNRYPKRKFGGSFEFSTVEDLRRYAALMHDRFGRLFKFPLFQYQCKLKAKRSAGANNVSVNALRGDFRVGRLALLIEGDKFEELIVQAVTSTTVTFTTVLTNSYSPKALLVPLVEAYTMAGAALTRRNPDDSASAAFEFDEQLPWAPFKSPLNTTVLTEFDGFPVLDLRAIGTEFEQKIDTGIRVVEYVGLPDVFTPWEQSQWLFSLRYQCHRVFDLDSWFWWVAFADHIQGASTTFLLPTFRSDLAVLLPATGGEDQVTLDGVEYGQHYFELDTYSRIVIESSAGRHFAKVTGVVVVGGNDTLTFDPPLPALPEWDEDQTVGFLLKVRNADDQVICDHYGLHTDISMAVRTVS